MKNLILFLLLSAAVSVSCTSKQKRECEQVRAAFDVGSGTTKLKVAKVNVCTREIIKILEERNRKVSYKEELSKNSGRLPKKIIEEGAQAIFELKGWAEKHRPDRYRAVATSAIRKASNGADLVAQVESKTGIKIKIISQQEEAELGFIAASTKAGASENQLVVWDIGGGSMQLATKDGDKFVTALGSLASVGFKNFIIESLQKKSVKKASTPNPIGAKNTKKALEFAEKFAREKTPQVIINKARTSKVIGIGGVHYYSVRGQLKVEKGQPFSLAMLEKAVPQRAKLTDKLIGGDYAATDVSNLILVQGFMKGLGIKEVLPLKVNLSDALLVVE